MCVNTAREKQEHSSFRQLGGGRGDWERLRIRIQKRVVGCLHFLATARPLAASQMPQTQFYRQDTDTRAPPVRVLLLGSYCVCNRRKSEQRLGTSMAVMQADLFAIDNGPVQAAEIKDLPRATVSALGRCDKAENGVELRDELGFARVI